MSPRPALRVTEQLAPHGPPPVRTAQRQLYRSGAERVSIERPTRSSSPGAVQCPTVSGTFGRRCRRSMRSCAICRARCDPTKDCS